MQNGCVMNTRKLLSLMIFVTFLAPLLSRAQSLPLCHVSIQSSRLAMDQRDEQRLKCLKQARPTSMRVPTCLKIAGTMEYSTAAEEARQFCLYNLKPTLQQCLEITLNMEYPDTGDEARWECLRRFIKKMSPKQCKEVAEKMSYPPNSERAELYCQQELK